MTAHLKHIRDPLYGFVSLTSGETRVVDTEAHCRFRYQDPVSIDGRAAAFRARPRRIAGIRARAGAGGAYGLSDPSGRGSFLPKGLYQEGNDGARGGRIERQRRSRRRPAAGLRPEPTAGRQRRAHGL